MNNISIYNERMAKAIKDKLWFKKFLNIPFFNGGNNGATVYDLGCADGELIRHLAPEFPNVEFVGIDESDVMINLARQRQMFPNERYITNMKVCFESPKNKPVIVIMSSVFHEIVNYNENPVEVMYDLFVHLQPDYIFFRDMIPDELINRLASYEDVEKIRKHADPDMLLEFNLRQGNINNQRNLVHFLLKYRYVENWNREVRENYFPCTYQELMKSFPGFDIIFSNKYTLPYIQQIVKEDFDIDLIDNTHVNIIMKSRSNINWFEHCSKIA